MLLVLEVGVTSPLDPRDRHFPFRYRAPLFTSLPADPPTTVPRQPQAGAERLRFLTLSRLVARLLHRAADQHRVDWVEHFAKPNMTLAQQCWVSFLDSMMVRSMAFWGGDP